VKQPEKNLTVPSIGTVRARKLMVAVSIQGTHIVYHRRSGAKRALQRGPSGEPQSQ
jgi:hypothetical protein